MKSFIKISGKFPEVKWKYSSPSDAIIETHQISNKEGLKIKTNVKNNFIKISVNSTIHQEYPWIAVKDSKDNTYQLESNLNKINNNSWELEISHKNDFKKIGIGVSNNSGHSSTKVISF